MADLRAILRTAAKQLERVGPCSVAAIVQPVRDEMTARGLPPMVHCGRKDLEQHPEQMIEWYAGQLLDIVDGEGWFAMNSWLNCVDKFCPEQSP